MFERKAYYDLVREQMEKVEISKIQPDEWKKYRDLRLEALKKEPYAISPAIQNKKEETDWQEEYWRSWLKLFEGNDAPMGCYVAKNKDCYVGMLGYSEQRKGSGTALLWGMYVNKNFRGKNIGESLMKTTLETLANDSRFNRVELVISGGNSEVMDFYEKFGFQMTEAKQTETENGEISESYVMAKELSKK